MDAILLIQIVSFIGGLVGLATGAFVIYDRLVRGSPIAYLHPEDFNVHLRIKNVADETIVLDRIIVSPPLLSPTMADDLRSSIEAAADKFYPSKADQQERTFAVLAPRAERSFGLVKYLEFQEANDSEPIEIHCEWRNTRKPLPWKRYAYIATTARDIRYLQTVAQKHGTIGS